MFDDWQFPDHLSLEHLEQALSNFIPGCHSTNVIEDCRAFAKRHSFFNLLDEFDATEVHKVIAVLC